MAKTKKYNLYVSVDCVVSVVNGNDLSMQLIKHHKHEINKLDRTIRETSFTQTSILTRPPHATRLKQYKN